MIDKKKLVERTKRYEQSEKGKARRKRHYLKNREKRLAYAREYYRKNNAKETCEQCGERYPHKQMFKGICSECDLKNSDAEDDYQQADDEERQARWGG